MNNQSKYMLKRHKVSKVYWWLFAGLILVGIIERKITGTEIGVSILGFALICAAIFAFYSNRCPHCKARYKGINPLAPKDLRKCLAFCPICGINLTGDETDLPENDFDFSLLNKKLKTLRYTALMNLISFLLLPCIFVLVFLSEDPDAPQWRVFIGIIFVLILIFQLSVLLIFQTLKCPQCNMSFSTLYDLPFFSGKLPKNMTYCPSCGAKLNIKKNT